MNEKVKYYKTFMLKSGLFQAITVKSHRLLQSTHVAFLILLLTLHIFLPSTIFAECIYGNCTNGQGTYTWPNGQEYVGEFRDAKLTDREPTHGLTGKNISVNLEMTNLTDREPTYGLTGKNMSVNLEMTNLTDREPTHGLTGKNMLVNLEMTNLTDRETRHILTGGKMLVNLETINLL